MSISSNKGACQLVCWLTASLIGLLVMWAVSGAVSFFSSLLIGLTLAVILAMTMIRLFCVSEPEMASTASARSGSTQATEREAAAGGETQSVSKVAPASAAVDTPSADGNSGAANTAAEVESTPDYDGDGVKEGADEGTRPAALDGPRDGGADDLKQIKGVGPKMEKMLNEMGFYHFDQIAGWKADEVAWVNANLKGFKGRVTRDNWVQQAGVLAAGGETEFSKRVEGGNVY